MLGLGDLILATLAQFGWLIFIQGPLQLLAIAGIALQYFAGGLQWAIFFNASSHIVDGVVQPPSWNEINIPWPYIGFCIVSIVIGVVLFVFQIGKVYFVANRDDRPMKIMLIKAIKSGLISLLVCASIPAIYFILTILLTFFISIITQIFSNGELNLADYIYQIGWTGDPDYAPIPPPDYSAPSKSEILQYNFLIQLLGTWFSLIGVILVSWMVVIKTVELMFLFLIGPLMAMFMPVDDCKKISIWKDFVLSKNCVIAANYIGYWLLLYVIQFGLNIVNSNEDISANFILKGFVIIAFIVGSTLAVLGVGPIVAAFFGDSFGFRESMSQAKATAAALLGTPIAGVAGGVGWIGKKIGKKLGFGQNRSNRSKGLSGPSGPGGDNVLSKLKYGVDKMKSSVHKKWYNGRLNRLSKSERGKNLIDKRANKLVNKLDNGSPFISQAARRRAQNRYDILLKRGNSIVQANHDLKNKNKNKKD